MSERIMFSTRMRADSSLPCYRIGSILEVNFWESTVKWTGRGEDKQVKQHVVDG